MNVVNNNSYERIYSKIFESVRVEIRFVLTVSRLCIVLEEEFVFREKYLQTVLTFKDGQVVFRLSCFTNQSRMSLQNLKGCGVWFLCAC